MTPTGQSRGLLLRLDMGKHTATYVHQYAIKGTPRYTAFQGNMSLLPNHNVLVGWGSSPFVSEFTYSGKLITDIAFPTPDLTYRGYVSSWVGLPSTDQLRAVAVKRNGKTHRVCELERRHEGRRLARARRLEREASQDGGHGGQVRL